jgi:hypothetical protein
MKDIMLFTYTNSIMRKKLADAGFSVIELKQSISGHYLASLFAEKKHIDYLAVVELSDENIEQISGLIELLLEYAVEIVLITVMVSDGIKELSLRYGIPDILEHSDPQRLLDYLLVTGESSESVGKIIIMDDDKPQVSILGAIIKRFNYRPIFVSSQNELFESLNQSNIQLVLLNLGIAEFDINSFVKRSFSYSEIKKLPCIAYKDIEKGLLVNELVSGLNRLTRMILTPEELFSFLVNLFLRRELSHKIERLDAAVHMDTIGQYLMGSLSQTIKTAGEEIYSMKNIIKGDDFNKLFSISDSLKKTFTKVEGLKWMIKEDFDRPTCVLGV